MDNVVTGPRYRITVLTSRLLRLEWSETGTFTDRPTQVVVNRELDPDPDFRVVRRPGGIELFTEHLHLQYDEQPFSSSGLRIQLLGNLTTWHSLWRFGEPFETLAGTARTLDVVDGACELEPGLLSRNGFSVVDDSASLLLNGDGAPEPRPEDGLDLYFFGYGRDYRACLRDFHRLTGPVPLIPRWALGNWWSRYHRYTADSYTGLMDDFAAQDIPFSVAVVDMDWHLVDIDPALGSGWTGYTWNTELFPDPPAFLEGLHERGLAVALNLHPADGVRRHEAAYEAMMRRLDRDPASGDPVSFDVTDPDFMAAYFDEVLHPLEEQGVDLWWLDWQQGPYSAVPGLDPLWMLNREHYRDAGRGDRRPLTFSRYAGLGSHRYPIGFSGDTVVSWASLEFQPYFTATASNVGYGWWSHDIGGHLHGYRDDELAARWFQLGTFSPVNRLHSTNNPFNSKEPARYSEPYREAMSEALRLRHRLVPYLYAMAWRASTESASLVEPLYHRHPEDAPAYEHPGAFFFGTELLVAPVTSPVDGRSRLAAASTWLPPGGWHDLFTGLRYDGGREVVLHRPLERTPVLGRDGGIVPLQPVDADARTLPERLDVLILAGADGSFDLVEDDGSGSGPDTTRAATTTMRLDWPRRFTVEPVTGAGDVVPARRDYTLQLRGVTDPGDVRVSAPHAVTRYEPSTRTLHVEVPGVAADEGFSVTGDLAVAPNDTAGAVYEILDRAWMGYEVKAALQQRLAGLSDTASAGQVLALGPVKGYELPDPVADALLEVLLATQES